MHLAHWRGPAASTCARHSINAYWMPTLQVTWTSTFLDYKVLPGLPDHFKWYPKLSTSVRVLLETRSLRPPMSPSVLPFGRLKFFLTDAPSTDLEAECLEQRHLPASTGKRKEMEPLNLSKSSEWAWETGLQIPWDYRFLSIKYYRICLLYLSSHVNPDELVSPYRLEWNEQLSGQSSHSTIHFLPCSQIQPEVWVFRERTGKESSNSVPKVIFSTVGEEGTINSTDPSYSVFNFMLLVYNMISYHPEFQKWPSALVAGCWGQEQMMSVTRRGHGSGQSAALRPSVQGQVGSMPGCPETQFSFGPQSNTMVAQTQGLSQPGDLTASSTSTRRKSLVKIKCY